MTKADGLQSAKDSLRWHLWTGEDYLEAKDVHFTRIMSLTELRIMSLTELRIMSLTELRIMSLTELRITSLTELRCYVRSTGCYVYCLLRK